MKAVLKICVSIGVLAFLLNYVDFAALLATVQGADVRFLLLALLLQTLSTAVAAWRWYIVMQRLEFSGSFRFYLKSYFKGSFFNQLLPSSIGGDAVRVLDVADLGYRKRDAFKGVFADRGLGILGLLIINLVALNVTATVIPSGLIHTLNVICMAGIGGFVLFCLLHRLPLHSVPLFSKLAALSEPVSRTVDSPKRSMVQTGLSVVIHLCSFLAIFSISRGVGMDTPLGEFFVIIPPVILLTVVPVTLAGWGVREGAMVGLFLLTGAAKEAVLAVSILYGVIVIVSIVPGFAVWMKNRKALL